MLRARSPAPRLRFLRRSTWAAAEGLVEQTARVTPEGIPPVDLTLLLQPEHLDRHARVVETVQAALKHYGEWYGAFPRGSLTVIDAPWWSDMAGASLPGVVIASARWLSPQGDRAFERQIIAGLARQYWSGAFGAPDGWMSEGLTLFSGTRAIHASLARTQYHTVRYFGGFVPHVIRSVPLSEDISDSRPYARHFDEVERPPWRPGATRRRTPEGAASRWPWRSRHSSGSSAGPRCSRRWPLFSRSRGTARSHRRI